MTLSTSGFSVVVFCSIKKTKCVFVQELHSYVLALYYFYLPFLFLAINAFWAITIGPSY